MSEGWQAPPVDRQCGSCANSFTAGTLVHTDEGQKPIEEITLGDAAILP